MTPQQCARFHGVIQQCADNTTQHHVGHSRTLSNYCNTALAFAEKRRSARLLHHVYGLPITSWPLRRESYWNGVFCKVHLFLVYDRYVYSRCSGFYCLLFACSQPKRLWLGLKRVKTLPNNKLLRIDMRVYYCLMEQRILVISATSEKMGLFSMKKKHTKLAECVNLIKMKKYTLTRVAHYIIPAVVFICFLWVRKVNLWKICRSLHRFKLEKCNLA